MREVSAFVYADEPAFFADPFFPKEADPAVVAELRAPERRERVRANPATARYREALRDGQPEPEDARATAAADRLRHGHRPARALPGLLRARGAAADGRGRPHADAGARRRDQRGGANASGLRTSARCEPGAWADFLVLRDDPLADIRNTQSLESVWIAGNRVPERRANP